MSKYITSIPLGDIERIKIYINSGKLPLRQIVAQEAPDLAITGNFWLYETYRPTCPIKADGKVLATGSPEELREHSCSRTLEAAFIALLPSTS